jgi:hypothetical protein
MAVDIHREADELARYYGELGRRLAQNGVRDVPDLLALHDQLRRALDAVSPQEIAWAVEQTQRLIDQLVRMDSNLQALRGLKDLMSRVPGASE